MTQFLRCTLLAVALLLVPVGAHAAKSTKPKMMLLDIPAEEGIKPSTIKVFNEFLAGELRNQGFDVVTSQDITAVLGLERQKQLMGCTESSCLAEIGGALGADYIVRGTVAPLGSKMALTLTVLDSKGAALDQERELIKSKDESDLVESMQAMVPKLVAPLKAQAKAAAPPAVATAPKEAESKPAATPPAAGGLQSSTEASSEGGMGGGKIAGYTLLGVGAAALLASGGVGYFAYSKAQTAATDASGVANTQPVAERQTAESAAWVSTGLLAGGVVAAGVGAVLLLVSGPSKAEAPRASVTVSPAGGGALAVNF